MDPTFEGGRTQSQESVDQNTPFESVRKYPTLGPTTCRSTGKIAVRCSSGELDFISCSIQVLGLVATAEHLLDSALLLVATVARLHHHK